MHLHAENCVQISALNSHVNQKISYFSGSELAGETSAALSSAAVLLKPSDPDYADKLVTHAKKLFQFADEYRGIYSDSIPEAAEYYM